MGKAAEMIDNLSRRTKIVLSAFVILCAFLVSGCEEKIFPPPQITVNEQDSASCTVVTITYNHHRRDQGGNSYIILNNPEEITAYKKQVEFLLKRLDESERRMNVHEPEAE